MHTTIQTLKNVLARATFTDDDLKTATLNLVDEIGDDLESDDYEAGAAVEEAEKELIAMIDMVDQSSEDTEAAIKNADDDDLDDEDEEL